MSASSFYYQHAQDCIDLANQARGVRHREALLTLAVEWLDLAAHAELKERGGGQATAHIHDAPARVQ